MAKGLDGSAFSFTTTRGHTTHISILWVFVLFTFFAVVLVSLAGFQEGLKERQFPDAKVNGHLEVTGDFTAKILAYYTGQAQLAGLTYTSLTNAQLDNSTVALTADRAYNSAAAALATGVGGLTLPSATKGALIVWRQTAQIAAANGLTFTRSGNDTFDLLSPLKEDGTGSADANNQLSLVGAVSAVATGANTQVAVAANANSMWGGIGSVLTFYCASDGVWSVNVPVSVANGTGATSVLSYA